MGKGPSQSFIDIYLRIRPVSRATKALTWDPIESTVAFFIPREESRGYVNNQREEHHFKFTGVLGPDSKQEEVFDRVAKDVIMGSLEGINGTVFAYGQTGSGKTYTISGYSQDDDQRRYSERGIIPRAISMMFREAAKRTDQHFDIHVSYMQIYNDVPYDLLQDIPGRQVYHPEDLPRVYFQETDKHDLVMRNLSLTRVGTEEEALELMWQGDEKRAEANTAMNETSSRSHCIFTIHVEARQHGSDLVRRSKLNLVDLAGSERVSKTGATGSVLNEATYINLSLHYLEQVIIALQEKATGTGRQHVPYRNCMMTMALRDSLGGNCRTTMVATVTPDPGQLDESISTCRFAQGVAMISNKVQVNEDVDPQVLIRRLRQEVRDLKDEIRLLKGGDEDRGPLTSEEHAHVRKMVEQYVGSVDPDAALNLGGSIEFIRGAFKAFKDMLLEKGSGGGGGRSGAGAGGGGGGGGVRSLEGPGGGRGGLDASVGVAGKDGGEGEASGDAAALADQVRKLRAQLKARDDEINVLVSMLSKMEAGGRGLRDRHAQGAHTQGPPLPHDASVAASTVAVSLAGSEPGTSHPTPRPAVRPPAAPPGAPDTGASDTGVSDTGVSDAAALEALMDPSVLADRSRAFEIFRKSFRKNQAIEDNKAMLKAKYDAAKALAQEVNAAKRDIQDMRGQLEGVRLKAAAAVIAEGKDPATAPPSPEEEQLRAAIESRKSVYRESYEALKDTKHEIEQIQMLLDKSRAQLQKDFEQWLAVMTRQARGGAAPGPGPASGSARGAWEEGPAPARPVSRPPPETPAQVAGAAAYARAAGLAAGAQGMGPGAGRPGISRASQPDASGLAVTGSVGPSAVYGGIGVIGGAPRAARGPETGAGSGAGQARASPPFTGDSAVDAEIARFYQLRQSVNLGQ